MPVGKFHVNNYVALYYTSAANDSTVLMLIVLSVCVHSIATVQQSELCTRARDLSDVYWCMSISKIVAGVSCMIIYYGSTPTVIKH